MKRLEKLMVGKLLVHSAIDTLIKKEWLCVRKYNRM